MASSSSPTSSSSSSSDQQPHPASSAWLLPRHPTKTGALPKGPFISQSIDDESLPPYLRPPRYLPVPPSHPLYKKVVFEGPIIVDTSFGGPHDEDAPLTEDEESYMEALEKTQGFGMPGFKTEVRFPNPIMPFSINTDEDTQRKFQNFCVQAIKHYNFKFGTCYSLVKAEKACIQAVSGHNYYITFQASIDLPDIPVTEKTFEALVNEPYTKGNPDFTVAFCRLQGDKSMGDRPKV